LWRELKPASSLEDHGAPHSRTQQSSGKARVQRAVLANGIGTRSAMPSAPSDRAASLRCCPSETAAMAGRRSCQGRCEGLSSLLWRARSRIMEPPNRACSNLAARLASNGPCWQWHRTIPARVRQCRRRRPTARLLCAAALRKQPQWLAAARGSARSSMTRWGGDVSPRAAPTPSLGRRWWRPRPECEPFVTCLGASACRGWSRTVLIAVQSPDGRQETIGSPAPA